MLIRVNALEYLYFFKKLAIALINQSPDKLEYDWDDRKVWTINTGNPLDGFRARELFATELASSHDYFLRKYDEVRKKTKDALKADRATSYISVQIEAEATTKALSLLGFETNARGFRLKAKNLWDQFIASPGFKSGVEGSKSEAAHLWEQFLKSIAPANQHDNELPSAEESLASILRDTDRHFGYKIKAGDKELALNFIMNTQEPLRHRKKALEFFMAHRVLNDDEIVNLFHIPNEALLAVVLEDLGYFTAAENDRGYIINQSADCLLFKGYNSSLLKRYCTLALSFSYEDAVAPISGLLAGFEDQISANAANYLIFIFSEHFLTYTDYSPLPSPGDYHFNRIIGKLHDLSGCSAEFKTLLWILKNYHPQIFKELTAYHNIDIEPVAGI